MPKQKIGVQVYVFVEDEQHHNMVTPPDNYKKISIDEAIKWLSDLREEVNAKEE